VSSRPISAVELSAGPAIEARILDKSFGALLAVVDFTFTVARGEAFAVVGTDGGWQDHHPVHACGIMDSDGGYKPEGAGLGYGA
jgi:hypothetical protein